MKTAIWYRRSTSDGQNGDLRKRDCKHILILICLLFMVMTGTVEAIPFGSLGARAMGMGNAFTAVADDLTCVFWNPAGIGFLNNVQITIPYGSFTSDRGSTENSLLRFQDNLYSTLLPSLIKNYSDKEMIISGDQNIGFIFGMPGLALSLIERSFASVTPHWIKERKKKEPNGLEPESSYISQAGLKTYNYAMSVCYGQKTSGYFLGINANYVEYRSFQAEIEVESLKSVVSEDLIEDTFHGDEHVASLWTFDAGLMMFMSGYRIGLTAKDLNTPRYTMPDDSKVKFDPLYRIGISFPLASGMFFDLDYDLTPNHLFDSDVKERNLALGVEMAFVNGQYKLRVGGHKNVDEKGTPFQYSLGAGMAIGFFSVDTAASINQEDDIWNYSAMVTINF